MLKNKLLCPLLVPFVSPTVALLSLMEQMFVPSVPTPFLTTMLSGLVRC